MIVKETNLEGCFIIKPKVIQDKRGYFLESFNHTVFKEGLKRDINFVQDNESYSSKGVLRGLHYQLPPFAQTKLVRVIQGSVLDVVVDIRRNSATFGQHVALEISEENKLQLFIPKGFAHGYIVLSETAIFAYKVDNYYHKESERGILYNDKDLNIDWKYPINELLISEKDKVQPSFLKADMF